VAQLPDEGRDLPTMTATATPTPSITPTVTPVIVPTQPPSFEPEPPEPEGLLGFLLPLLGVILMALLVILLLVIVGTFLWWWWEWRGMGGLSPVTRAYARLERFVALIGIELSGDQTPAERRKRIVGDLPEAGPPVSTITQMYMAERYGRRTKHPLEAAQDADRVDSAWRETRGNILQRWLQRLLMPWRR
jgi:hypothetical protein